MPWRLTTAGPTGWWLPWRGRPYSCASFLYSEHADPVAGGRAGEDVEVAVGQDAGAGDQYCPGLYEEGGPPFLSVLS